MNAFQATLWADLNNRWKSNNGVTNEIRLRKVRAQIGSAKRGIHLQLRVHFLSGMCGSHERGLSELRRRIGAPAEEM
jgi:hypothetical protein